MATASHTSDVGTTASRSFARFCADLDYEVLPQVAVDRVKHFFIDYLGIALHASTLDSSRPLRKLAAVRPIPGGATLLGRSDLVNAHWAAFANGMAAHSMELDDTYLPGSIHNESFVFSPSLALAEERGISGKRFVTAIVPGFEVACRVAAALQPSATNARGFHPTGTTGALGAAAAAGTLLGLDAEQLSVAIGVACSQAGGLLEFVTDGTWTKRFHGGWAAHAGIIAAELAQYGMTAPRTAIEGKFGYLHAYSGSAKPELLVAGEGQNLAIVHTALKYYPCNYYIQAVNDAVLELERPRLRRRLSVSMRCREPDRITRGYAVSTEAPLTATPSQATGSPSCGLRVRRQVLMRTMTASSRELQAASPASLADSARLATCGRTLSPPPAIKGSHGSHRPHAAPPWEGRSAGRPSAWDDCGKARRPLADPGPSPGRWR